VPVKALLAYMSRRHDDAHDDDKIVQKTMQGPGQSCVTGLCLFSACSIYIVSQQVYESKIEKQKIQTLHLTPAHRTLRERY